MKNEPAFPTEINTEHFSHPSTIYKTGMTLRDYFAAKAMQGFIQYSAAKGIYTPPDNELASTAYQLADAMLKARET